VSAAFLVTAPSDPDDPHPLTTLCNLSNVDKHISIHAVVHYVREAEITTVPVIVGTNVEALQGLTELTGRQVLAKVAIPRPVSFQPPIDIRSHTVHGVVIAATDRTPVLLLGRSLDSIEDAVAVTASLLHPPLS
jgi:hypothetical protein